MEPSDPLEYFRGGLGDVILKVYRTDAYRKLEDLTRRTIVVVMSTNPYAIELFRWHPMRLKMVLVDLSPHFQAYRGEGNTPDEAIRRAFEFAGLPFVGLEPDIQQPTANTGTAPIFHAPDTIDSEGHIVFQPFAGQPGRCLPEATIRNLIDVFAGSRRQVYIVTRSYLREAFRHDGLCHDIESIGGPLPPNVRLLQHTSVPATLTLVQRCSHFIGGDSSLTHAAWSEGKPTVYLRGRVHTRFEGYEWGAGRADCYHASYDTVDFNRIAREIG